MTSCRTLVPAFLGCAALAALGCAKATDPANGSDGDGGSANGSSEIPETAGAGAAEETGTGGGVSLNVPPDGGEGGATEDPCAGDDPPPECNPPVCGDGEQLLGELPGV